MEDLKIEKSLDDYPLPVTIDKTRIILKQMENYICKIENKNGNGTGFFCYIPNNNNKLLPVLITNNHVINQDTINKNKILISFNKDKKLIQKQIKLNENRKIYTNEQYDTTIIEIIKEKDEIDNFLELDDNILNEYINVYNKSIYVIQYPKIGYYQEASVSYGILKDIQDDYNIIHYCSTQHGSSGSPILNLENNKVIGIHKESSVKFNFNKGTLINFPIKEFLNNKNLLTIKKPNKIIHNDINEQNYEGVLGAQENIKRKKIPNNNKYKINDDSKIIKKKQKLNIENNSKNKDNLLSKTNIKREKSLDNLNFQNVNAQKSLNKFKNNFNIKFENDKYESNNINKVYGIKKNIKTDLIDKKKEINKIYSIVNKFFFEDVKQNYVKLEYISATLKFEFETELIKENKKGQHELKDYCKKYIEASVLPLFKRKDLNYEEKLIIKHNLEEFLECCEIDKNTYLENYFEELKIQKEMERKKLVEALRKFRQEFGISENEYADDGIINRLKKNNYDIYKTFQDMFG